MSSQCVGSSTLLATQLWNFIGVTHVICNWWVGCNDILSEIKFGTHHTWLPLVSRIEDPCFWSFETDFLSDLEREAIFIIQSMKAGISSLKRNQDLYVLCPFSNWNYKIITYIWKVKAGRFQLKVVQSGPR